jgi:hypothetical protein
MLPMNADVPRDIDVFFMDEHDEQASKIGAPIRGTGHAVQNETRRLAVLLLGRVCFP